MSEISGGPSEAAVLLMSLLSNVSSVHGEDNNLTKNVSVTGYLKDDNNNNNK